MSITLTLTLEAPITLQAVQSGLAVGPGVAIGGTTGQQLVKASATDYDTEWTTPSSGDVEEAPQDGTPYARQDAGWVSAGGVGGYIEVVSVATDTVNIQHDLSTLNPNVSVYDNTGVLVEASEVLVVDANNITVTFGSTITGRIFVSGGSTVVGSGAGDMLKVDYDPNLVASDTFDMANMVEAANAKVLTAAERTAIGTNTSKVSFPEAPSDGSPYARQDAGWVAAGGGGGGALTAYKTADETKTNDAILSNDADVKVVLEINSVYSFVLVIYELSNAIPDFKYGLFYPTGTTVAWMPKIYDFTAPWAETQTDVENGSVASKMEVVIGIIYTGATAGDFGLMWGQNTSDAASTTLLKGTNIIVTKLN